MLSSEMKIAKQDERWPQDLGISSGVMIRPMMFYQAGGVGGALQTLSLDIRLEYRQDIHTSIRKLQKNK